MGCLEIFFACFHLSAVIEHTMNAKVIIKRIVSAILELPIGVMLKIKSYPGQMLEKINGVFVMIIVQEKKIPMTDCV